MRDLRQLFYKRKVYFMIAEARNLYIFSYENYDLHFPLFFEQTDCRTYYSVLYINLVQLPSVMLNCIEVTKVD